MNKKLIEGLFDSVVALKKYKYTEIENILIAHKSKGAFRSWNIAERCSH
jgi:hypothetical protein